MLESLQGRGVPREFVISQRDVDLTGKTVNVMAMSCQCDKFQQWLHWWLNMNRSDHVSQKCATELEEADWERSFLANFPLFAIEVAWLEVYIQTILVFVCISCTVLQHVALHLVVGHRTDLCVIHISPTDPNKLHVIGNLSTNAVHICW